MPIEEMQSSEGHDFFLYADVAATHDGDLDYLKRMIVQAANVKVDAIKFHVTKVDNYMTGDHPIYPQAKKRSYNYETWREVISYAGSRGLKVIGLANDVESSQFLKKQNVYAIEIHATGLNDVFLLESLTGYQGFVLLGISGATLDEMSQAVEQLKNANISKIYLVYGFQNYPTSLEAINFNKLRGLQSLFGLPLVYADHTAKDSDYRYILPLIAYAIGAKAIEKHLILNKDEPRTDHDSAIEPEEFTKLKQMLDTVSRTFKNESLMPDQYERAYRQLKKSIVAKVDIPRGRVIAREALTYKRTGKEGKGGSSVSQLDIEKLIGRKARRDIQHDEPIDWSMIE